MTTAGRIPTRSRIAARLTGLGGVLLLAALLVGIPVALWVFGGGNPLPSSLPSLEQAKTALLSPDDGSVFLQALLVVGWLAWASFAVSVLVEAFAALRGVQAPRLPGLRLQQRGAAGLIAIVALLFTAGQAGAATTLALSSSAPTMAPVSVTAPLVDAAPTEVAAPVAQAPTEAASPTVAYTVQPGDTPWGIAESLLGDGALYPQILTPNYGVPQSDGGALTDGNWLQPGWVLQVPAGDTAAATPATAAAQTGATTVTVQRGDTLSGIADTQLGNADLTGTLFSTNAGLQQPDGRTLSNPDQIDVGWTLVMPATTTVAASSAADQQAASQATADQAAASQAQATQDAADQAARAAAEQAAASQAQAAQNAADQAAQQQAAQQQAAQATADQVAADQAAAAEAAAAAAATQAPVTPPAETTTSVTQAPPESSSTTEGYTDTEQAQSDVEDGISIRTATGVGSLLAAGVLGLLAVRRRNQQRHRAPGASIAMPTGPEADTEHELRAIAAPLDITLVDLALRTLAWHCHATDQPLPYVRAARLTRDQFELYLGAPAQLPAPWAGTSDTTVWTLPNDLDDADLITDEQADTIAAPYPSLVTIGHDLDGAHVLLDLEEAGALALTGDPADTTEVINALALELATSQWADDLQVTVVGACPDLEAALRTGRVRHLPDTGTALADLNRRADLDRRTLHEIGAPDLHHARPEGTAPGIAVPEILLIASTTDGEQRAALDTLLDALPRVAVAAVTHGAPMGEWSLTLSDTDDTAVLSPIGLTLRPQRVDARTYRHLIASQVLAADDTNPAVVVDEPLITDLPAPVAADVDEPTPAAAAVVSADDIDTADTAVEVDVAPAEEQPVDAVPVLLEVITTDTAPDAGAAAIPAPETVPISAVAGEQVQVGGADATVHQLHPAPRVLVLGPVHIEHLPDDVEVADKLVEVITYIALNPGGNHVAIDDAIMPGKPQTDNARNTRMARARRMLGRAADGADYLPRHTTPDGYRLDPAVTTDWQQWCDLLPTGADTASTDDLEAALSLVRGRPFAGIKRRYYAWAERTMQEMIGAIIDASWELARRRLLEGRYQAATTAAAIGLDIEPGVERLARIQILAAHAGGNPEATQAAIGRLLDVTDELGGDLEDVTEQLIHDLAAPTTTGRRELVDAYAR